MRRSKESQFGLQQKVELLISSSLPSFSENLETWITQDTHKDTMVKYMVHIEIACYVSFTYYGSKVWNNSDFLLLLKEIC